MNVTVVGIVVVLVFGENLWEIVTNGVTIFYRRMRGCNSVNMLGFCPDDFFRCLYGFCVMTKYIDKFIILKHYRFAVVV